MQATLIDPGGAWSEETRLFQLDDSDYYLSTVTEPAIEPGVPVDVRLDPDDPETPDSFDGVVFESAALDDDRWVITLTREGRPREVHEAL